MDDKRMKQSDVRDLPLGLYRIHFIKECGGGYSLASVGQLHDGRRWFAPSNWIYDGNKPTQSGAVVSNDWSTVERAELIRDLDSDKQIAFARALSIKQGIDPGIAEIVRDLFLVGSDVDAIAVLAEELGMSQFDITDIAHRLSEQAQKALREGHDPWRRLRTIARDERNQRRTQRR